MFEKRIQLYDEMGYKTYVLNRPVVDHGGHLSLISGAEVHTTSAAIEETVLLASKADGRGIDDGS